MWLLNTHTITLRNFVADVPEYVILSHTWGQEEVTFDDIGEPDQCKNLKGYEKILGCCRRAVQDGFEWAWIDTCCIDKRSSAELSEAINSMYKWYWNAAICYAYLEDVTKRPKFSESKWFTRGWTLQELLAPSTVEFYTQSWSFIGTKAGLLVRLNVLTGIDSECLKDRERIQLASLATRFSWASRRETTREEDLAYCLLGLVGVNMPMLYGEGNRAFHRLQLEIVRNTNDHTIFAWDTSFRDFSYPVGVLAPSPSWFQHSAGIRMIHTRRPAESLTHEVTNNGLRITLPIIKTGVDEITALLHCENSKGSRLGIQLSNSRNENQQYGRPAGLTNLVECEEQHGDMSTLYLVLDSEAKHDKPWSSDLILKGDLVYIREVRGDCGYQIANVVINTGCHIENVDIDQNQPFKVQEFQLVCLNIATTAGSLGNIAILFGFSSGRFPVFYTTGSDLDIQEMFEKGWSADLFDSRSCWANGASIDCFGAVLDHNGKRIFVKVEFKKRLISGKTGWGENRWACQSPSWEISTEINKCVCSSGAHLSIDSPACGCLFPLMQEEEKRMRERERERKRERKRREREGKRKWERKKKVRMTKVTKRIKTQERGRPSST